MTSAAQILAVWLMPAAWLELPALILDRGPEGLWIGLVLTLAPLIALGLSPRAPALPEGEREPLFLVVVLLLTVGLLLWAQIVLAGDVAVSLGQPRWVGLTLTAAAGWLLTAWRHSRRLIPILLLGGLLAASLPLAELVRVTGVGPIGAWERVANQSAFSFPPSSPWVTGDRDLRMSRERAAIGFDEEHRITAPAGGTLHVRAVDGNRIADIEWEVAPGQAVTLRPGDQLLRPAASWIRFEAGKRVPGAPPSGIAWAAGQTPTWPTSAGLLLTLVLGAMTLLRSGVGVRMSRRAVMLVGGGLLSAFFWAQGWAVYSVLSAPDLFLGGVNAQRLIDVQAFPLRGSPWRQELEMLLLAGGFAAFLAGSVALRERLGALDRTGGGEIGRDLGLWGAVFGVAAAASLWPLDPWALTLLALGGAASSLGPAVLWPEPAAPRAATAAGLVGLAVFVGLATLGLFYRGASGLAAGVLAYPALAGAPAGAAMLWITRRVLRR